MLVKKVSFYKIPSRKIIQSMKLNNFSLITPKLMHLDTCPLSRLRFLDSYNNLPIDIMKGSVPTRLRRYANFHVKKEDNDYNIYYTGKLDFIQDVVDYRNELRIFEPMEEHFFKDKFITSLLEKSVLLCLINNNGFPDIDISLHQVRQICYPGIESHNSPEGIHQDGADYIISALVMNYKNIVGGESIIYDENKEEIYRRTLNKDQGIFQEDRKLWHYVTPIQCSSNNLLGYRDIIGIDININN